MLEAGGCLLMMTCQRNWGLNCTGGQGSHLYSPVPFYFGKQAGQVTGPCFTDKETEARGSFLDLIPHEG